MTTLQVMVHFLFFGMLKVTWCLFNDYCMLIPNDLILNYKSLTKILFYQNSYYIWHFQHFSTWQWKIWWTSSFFFFWQISFFQSVARFHYFFNWLQHQDIKGCYPLEILDDQDWEGFSWEAFVPDMGQYKLTSEIIN